MSTSAAHGEAGAASLPPSIYAMMAVGGLTAANSHYASPLLPSMAAAFHVPEASLSLLPAAAQAGLAVGLLVILPLADIIERRGLLITVLIFLAAAAALQGVAPDLPVLFISAFMLGLGCTGAQILTPYAALIAPQKRQGEAAGLVLSGILCGAFLSKVIAGLAGATWGWRSPFLISSGCMLVAAVLMARTLPRSAPATPIRYLDLLASMGRLVRQHPNLRRHALNGAMTSGSVTAFWATYALHLSHAFGYGPAVAGLFGLVGIAGTIGASVAGRQVDGGRFGRSCILAGLTSLGGFACLWLGAANLALFIIGVLAIDAGAGLNHASNQSAAFTLDPTARGRINSVYMASYFLGGAVCTTLGALLYDLLGWSAVCGLGASLALLTTGLQLVWPIVQRGRAAAADPLQTAADAVQPL